MVVPNVYSLMVNSKISRSTDQVSTELQGDAVILNVKTGKYFNLNSVGSHIWKLLEEPKSMLSIVEAILSEYDVERARCEEDVFNVLRKLQLAGLVEIASESPDPSEDGR